MVVSLKANRKRILAFFVLALVVVGALFFLHGGEQEEQEPIPGGTNEERVAFLESFGWQVQTEPTETREVMIPSQFNDVYTAYNVMQQAQGFDLKPYAGESCTQYLYKVENYPDETEVYATLLVYGDQIIGGDLASSQVDGFMHGFAPDSARFGETGAGGAESSPAETSASPQASVSPEGSPAVSAESGGESTVTGQAEASAESAASGTAGEVETGGEPLPEEAYPTD